eukprot:TCONS_00043364-protein
MRWLLTVILMKKLKKPIKAHLDHGDVVYDRPGNSTFSEKLESVQYDACLAITGCFRGTSREKNYLELGLESLSDRRLSRRLIYFYKIINGFEPAYLSNVLPPQRGEEERRAGRRIQPPFEAPFCR